MINSYQARPGNPDQLGATFDGGGVNFALFSEHATTVELCLFDRAEALVEHTRIPLAERTRRCLARLRPESPSRPALRVPGTRTVGPGEGTPLQSDQARAGPLCASIGPRAPLECGASECPDSRRKRSLTNHSRQRAVRAARDGSRPGCRQGFRVARRHRASHSLARHIDLRAAREGLHGAEHAPSRLTCAAPISASRPNLRSITSRRLVSRRSS